MKITKLHLSVGIAAFALGAPAFAQEVATEASASAPAATAAPAQAAPVVSAEDMDKYAKAYLKVSEINGDTAISQEEKQAAMAAAVEEFGFDNAKFNEITTAWQNDEALKAQFTAATEKHKAQRAAAADAAPTTAATEATATPAG